MMISHFRIPGNSAIDFAIHSAADVPNIIPHDAARNDHSYTWNRGADSLNIGVSQTILQDVTLVRALSYFLLFGRFNAAQNDILTAQIFNLFLRFETCSFTNCEHRND